MFLPVYGILKRGDLPLVPQLCSDQQGLAVIRYYFLLMFDWGELKCHKNSGNLCRHKHRQI